MTLGKLDQFGKPAGNADKLDRVLAQIFQHPAHKIAHIKDRFIGQAIECPNGGLGRFSRRTGDMVSAGGAGNINAAMDGMDPRRTAKRDDNPRGSQHRKTTDNAQTRVPRFGGNFLPAGNGNFDLDI